MPIIFATEGAECGLACIAMIASYYGHDVDLTGLRRRFSMSLNGATLRGIMELAGELDLSARPIRAELDALQRLPTPAILHWDLTHYVVLKRVRGRMVEIHDPAAGAVRLDLDEVSRHFTGVVLELAPAANFKPIEAKAPVRLTSLWSRISGVSSAVWQVLALSLALQVTAFALPFQLQLTVDEGIGRGAVDLLGALAIGFAGVVVVQTLLEAMRAWALQVFGQMLTFQMIGNIVRHLLRLPTSFFEKRHVGDIVSRIGSAGSIQDLLTRGFVSTIIDGLMACIAIVIMLIYSVTLTSIVVSAVCLNLIISAILFPALRRRMEEQLVERAREQSHLMETVRAASIVKIMGREIEREATWRNLLAAATNASVGAGKISIWLSASQALVTGLQAVLVLYVGALITTKGEGLSIGMLLAFLSFGSTFTERANALVSQMVQFRAIGLHLQRLSDIVATPADTQGTETVLPAVAGHIELRNIHFRYGVGESPVLSNANLTIQAGEFLAFTGPSGGGKTTLIKLLLGLYPLDQGDVLLDGHAADAVRWRAWRKHVGVVSQDDRLLSGTIAENIAFFDSDIDMSKVEAAARMAEIDLEIQRKPMGYQSLVGDMGSSLSGGQKQRVLLARALYRNPTVLILDEGTAGLDATTEAAVVNLIGRLGMTRIVVAHRPALLLAADRVVEVRDGNLSECAADEWTTGANAEA